MARAGYRNRYITLAVDANALCHRTLLSMIWTLVDFNSVYLLSGRRAAT